MVPLPAESGYYLNMDTEVMGMRAPHAAEQLVGIASSLISDRLPASWGVTQDTQTTSPDSWVDGSLLLRAPDATEVRVLVEVKRALNMRDVSLLTAQLDTHLESFPKAIGMVAANYLSKSVRDRLASAGYSYVDATGNLLLNSREPLVYISDRGADKDPWRGPGRPRGTLKGAPAANVVRALLDFSGPWRARDLVQVSATSTGSVYRVVEFLQEQELATRDAAGIITVPDWAALLRRWSDDYQFQGTNNVSQWIAPRGLDSFLDRVRGRGRSDYAITGSVAAATWAPYAPARTAMVYCAHPEEAASEWGLRATDRGANVLLAAPNFDVALQRSVETDGGLLMAAPTQVAVDLMTGPGRSPSEAEELVKWMERNEDTWRTER